MGWDRDDCWFAHCCKVRGGSRQEHRAGGRKGPPRLLQSTPARWSSTIDSKQAVPAPQSLLAWLKGWPRPTGPAVMLGSCTLYLNHDRQPTRAKRGCFPSKCPPAQHRHLPCSPLAATGLTSACGHATPPLAAPFPVPRPAHNTQQSFLLLKHSVPIGKNTPSFITRAAERPVSNYNTQPRILPFNHNTRS